MPKKEKKKKLRIKINPIVVNIVLFIILVPGFVVSLYSSFDCTKREEIMYKETSTVNYKVYLKDNNFYETKYLEDGMAYVASLIDKIYIDYNYSLGSSAITNLDVNYKIVAKLTIGSQNNSKVFFQKEYDLTELVKDKMTDTNIYQVSREAIIDYHYYNDLANEFRSSYAVNTVSNLEVQFIVEEKNNEKSNHKMSNYSVTSLTIPLSEQEINIAMKEKQVNNVKTLVKEAQHYIKSKPLFITSIVLFLMFVAQIVCFIRYIIKKHYNFSKYDRYINRLLSGYDRIIVNVKTPHKKDKYEIIHVNGFQELIDVRDNTKEHINYYIIEEHQKCEFYVTNDNDLYLYEVSAADFDGKKENDNRKNK